METLSQILIDRGAWTQQNAEHLLNGTADEFGRLKELAKQGTLPEELVYEARAQQLGVPFVRLDEEEPDPRVVNKLSVRMSHEHEVAALELVAHYGTTHVKVAMVDPENVVALDDVALVFSMPVYPVLTSPSDLHSFIDRHHRADSELSSLSDTMAQEDSGDGSGAQEAIQISDDASEDAPVIRFVNLVLGQAIRDRASDIHIEPAEDQVRVRYRIDGVLQEMPSAPKQIQAGLISRLKIMASIDIAERRIPQDGRMAVSVSGRKIDLRVATLPTVWGEKIVMRILDQSSTALDIKALGMSERNLEVYHRAYTQPYGLALITGPTGSGKSTTLYSTIQDVANPCVNIITVEDPVEYRLPGINQVQVNNQAGLTFAKALRSILRSDPDIALIGEIRDAETATIAIEAALTGHMVFSTLHTNDAASAVTRLGEMGVEPFLVGTALDVVVAQRLVRRLCSQCKEPHQLTPEEAESSALSWEQLEQGDAYRPVGCSACAGTGYRGRAAVHEVLDVTPEISRMAVQQASSMEIQDVATRNGMRSLRQDGMDKVLQGLTTVEEVLRVVV
ncbi:GspE/PulE family protein [Nesterenkonia sp. NBAIMH1]|uniref:GspE/PulE family protein n=1 Tax=Nesterenkonia sp. NBAIMH1 TaxID=2600320 RepID=UPI0011B4B70E|nr:ATPase, T2SS/T4P/T4SS family [Nesterenkonia sp. NBAIMH1]